MNVNLIVYKSGKEYFSTRTFGDQKNPLIGRNETIIFELKKDVTDDETREQLEEEARQEARKRGLTRVINLTK
jgi:hypothetical protein